MFPTFLYLITCLLTGSLVTWIFLSQRANMANAIAQEKIHALELRIESVANETKVKDARISVLEQELSNKKIALAELEVRIDEERRHTQEKLKLISEQKELLKNEFQNLANSILDEKSKKFTEYNKESVNRLISPLREQLGDFKKKVEDVYDKEAQGRAALANEINHLKNLNIKISQDAENLTTALKGDSKIQGNWGELTLERLLEMAGLEEGREYETQVHALDDDGNRFLPDVIIRLPQQKDVIVDSKVSLTAYEQYCSADTDADRGVALKNHLMSLRNHIKGLSNKNYEKLQGIRSLDFVLLFIPIEAALITAIKQDNAIFSDAFSKNIIIVCPSTLLVTLRTISYTWRIEYQNINAKEIARRAGALYDKFCGFLETLQSIGESLKKANEKYDSAMKQLSTGKGNLIKRVSDFNKMGINGKKELPKKLLELESFENGNEDA